MAAENRFTNRDSKKENIEYNLPEMLVKIMQQEFPDDPIYKSGEVTPKKLTQTINGAIPTARTIDIEDRNGLNILTVESGSNRYAEYKLEKSYPTITEDDLDELIDEEWSYFIRQNTLRPVTSTGLFLINTEIELNPADYHDAYIQRGPSNIETRINNGEDLDTVIRTTFCVFYIENGVALPIPNYQTLEVLLVERGLTYDAIQEATPEQMADFDMVLDGSFIGDRTANRPNDALEEFQYRQVLDRTNDWNNRVRFASGYQPSAPFLRDPGDYLKPVGYQGSTGTTDLYVMEDPSDYYFDLVFQKQTYKEKLRAKYEGKMVVLRWPVPYDETIADSGTDIESDDLVFQVRMMINGFWKQVIDPRVLRLYATTNGYDISQFSPSRRLIDVGETYELYGANGLINILVEAGGVDAIQNTGEASPIWNDFPHIVEADRLDYDEYKTYIDNYSNGGQPFGIIHLKPYEPEGSLSYYPQSQITALQEQVREQQEIESLREHILEFWPLLAARVAALELVANGLPANYSLFYDQRLSNSSPLYKIITADSSYSYIKKKRRNIVTKDERTNLLEMFERNERISFGAFNNPADADRIIGVSNWGRVWDNRPDNDGINAYDIVFAAISPVAYAGYVFGETLSDINNLGKNEMPRNLAGIRKRGLLKDALYINGMIAYEVGRSIQNLDLKNRTTQADNLVLELRNAIAEAKDFVIEIDDLLIAAESVEAFQDIYTRITTLNAVLSSFNDDGLSFCNQVRIDIDNVFKDHLNRLYNGVQYFRQRVHDEIGNRSKFGVTWSGSARSIIEQYLPGKRFDDYLPTEE
jgi:hypothetical protein